MWYRRKIDEQNQVFTRTVASTGKEESVYAPNSIGDGRYEIVDVLSVSGGFGIIYKAVDLRMRGHKVLIKSRRYDEEPGLFMFQYDNNREGKIERIRSKTYFEAKCLNGFKQGKESRMPILNDIIFDYCPSIYGPHKDMDGNQYVIDEDYVYEEPYIVMQMVDGINLGDYMDQGIEAIMSERGYSCFYEWERAVLEYCKELCTIFMGFHMLQKDEKGNQYYYIYQDLKPDNIMITNDRFITLLDFGGITKVNLNEDGTTMVGKGSPGLGTFGYQAPEARNTSLVKCLDKRSDIYTFGATMYQLLTGNSMLDVLVDEDGEIPYEKHLKGVCTDATYRILDGCLKQDRNKRFKDMSEIKRLIMIEGFHDVKGKINEFSSTD